MRELKELAAAALPHEIASIVTVTEHPFIQAIMDVESPTMAIGRICLLGTPRLRSTARGGRHCQGRRECMDPR